MNSVLFFFGSLVVSFAAVFFVKGLNFGRGIIGIDINKKDRPKIPESTGIALLVPFVLLVLHQVFFAKVNELIPWLAMVAVFAIVGFYDDRKHKFLSKATPWLTRALPIGIVSIAFSYFFAPEGVWIIPLGLLLAGIASFQNTFAGLNGLEIGSGFIISLFTTYILWGTPYQLIALGVSGAILGLLMWNKFPAKVFPGDSGTLIIGSANAGLLLLTHDIRIILLGFLLYLPHMIDFFVLKMGTNKHDATQQKFQPYKLLLDGNLGIPDYPDKKERLDFAKLIIKIFGPLKEWQIVLVMWAIVSANGLLMLYLFKQL
ncbi:MAG: hypothetical protein Q7K42_01390 [Candidatus Diapherotrites archaeon]|nr:hypothetical protein [Candidatus Diapherotrites archaeon]